MYVETVKINEERSNKIAEVVLADGEGLTVSFKVVLKLINNNNSGNFVLRCFVNNPYVTGIDLVRDLIYNATYIALASQSKGDTNVHKLSGLYLVLLREAFEPDKFKNVSVKGLEDVKVCFESLERDNSRDLSYTTLEQIVRLLTSEQRLNSTVIDFLNEYNN